MEMPSKSYVTINGDNNDINYNVALSVKGPPPQKYTTISRQDYDILLEGADVSTERATRDVCTGIWWTALVGITGIAGTTQIVDEKGHLVIKSSIFLMLLITATIISGILNRYFHHRIQKVSARKTYTDVKNRLDNSFSSP